MASVGVIHTTRRLLSRTALKVYALVISAYALGIMVWVSRVEENFVQVLNGGVLAVGQFVLTAFANTSTVVQLVTLVAVFCVGSLMVDLARNVSQPNRSF